jgi:hypothetical protein
MNPNDDANLQLDLKHKTKGLEMTQRFRLFKNGISNGKRDDNPVGGSDFP